MAFWLESGKIQYIGDKHLLQTRRESSNGRPKLQLHTA